MKVINSTLTILLMGAVLAGCAQETMLIPKSGQSAEKYNSDRAACINESNKYYGASGGNPSESDVFLVCMKGRGYEVKQKF